MWTGKASQGWMFQINPELSASIQLNRNKWKNVCVLCDLFEVAHE